jgi:hypothetical protein
VHDSKHSPNFNLIFCMRVKLVSLVFRKYHKLEKEYLRTGRCGEYLDVRDASCGEAGENCIMRSSTICTLYERMIKWRTMRNAEHVVRMADMRNMCKRIIWKA